MAYVRGPDAFKAEPQPRLFSKLSYINFTDYNFRLMKNKKQQFRETAHTGGRFSRAGKGLCTNHVSPEAADRGPIAALENGDVIEINLSERNKCLSWATNLLEGNACLLVWLTKEWFLGKSYVEWCLWKEDS